MFFLSPTSLLMHFLHLLHFYRYLPIYPFRVVRSLSQEFFISLENGKTGLFCFTRVGEPVHISELSLLFGVEAAWHTVLICCTMCGTGQPQIGDGGSQPGGRGYFESF